MWVSLVYDSLLNQLDNVNLASSKQCSAGLNITWMSTLPQTCQNADKMQSQVQPKQQRRACSTQISPVFVAVFAKLICSDAKYVDLHTNTRAAAEAHSKSKPPYAFPFHLIMTREQYCCTNNTALSLLVRAHYVLYCLPLERQSLMKLCLFSLYSITAF